MRLVMHGGFGEKGRTSISIEVRGYRLLLDAGIKTGAGRSEDRYPLLSASELAATDAIVVTHGHEDHAGALLAPQHVVVAGRAERAGCGHPRVEAS